jgi:hypothetical protein
VLLQGMLLLLCLPRGLVLLVLLALRGWWRRQEWYVLLVRVVLLVCACHPCQLLCLRQHSSWQVPPCHCCPR